MAYKKQTWKMHTKILLLCLGVSALALILQMLLFRQSSSKLIYNQAQNESVTSLKSMQEDVYSLIRGIERVLIRSYNEKEFIIDLKENLNVEELREKYSREAYTFATENFETTDSVLALYMYTKDHEIISTYRRAVTPRHNYPLDIYTDSAAYNSEIVKNYVLSDETHMLVSSYYNSSREKEIMRYVLKLYSIGTSRNVIGYLVCDVEIRNLLSIIKKYHTNENVYLWFQPIGDRPSICFGSLEKDEVEAVQKFQQSILVGEKGDKSAMKFDNRTFFYAEQSKYNFGVYTIMSQDIFLENQKLLARNLMLILGVLLALAILVTYVMSKTLTRPLENMTATAKQIKEGNTKLRLEVLKEDEIGILSQNFNEMLDKIEELISKEYETKLLLNRAEYHALQAQINPHFLYNTLDTMESIAEMEGCRKVSGLCQSLSNIFRYSLDMKHPFSSVSKEMAHLKNYIYVMDMRMQDHVNYEYDMEERALKVEIPRLSIQPIVENALNHGLRNSRNEKRVKISAHIVDDRLEIVVEDNGIGMSQETISKLLGKESEEKMEHSDGGKSIGLNNIHMRMQMLYGKDYGIEITSEIGVGTSVKLCVPQKNMGDKLWRSSKY